MIGIGVLVGVGLILLDLILGAMSKLRISAARGRNWQLSVPAWSTRFVGAIILLYGWMLRRSAAAR